MAQAKAKVKKGKKPTAVSLAKLKKLNVGAKRGAGDVTGQGQREVLACWYDGTLNVVDSDWTWFVCYRDGCVNWM